MDELHFTLKLALKLFAGLILLGVWLMARQQAKLDKRNREAMTGVSVVAFSSVIP